jgi:hypothetical protein
MVRSFDLLMSSKTAQKEKTFLNCQKQAEAQKQ